MSEISNDAELTCQELVELVTDYFENVLPENERTRVEQHLAACSGCDRYVEQMRQTVQTLGKLQTRDLSPEAQAKLLNVFRDWRTS
jgi:anti-sigma factor RsiW